VVRNGKSEAGRVQEKFCATSDTQGFSEIFHRANCPATAALAIKFETCCTITERIGALENQIHGKSFSWAVTANVKSFKGMTPKSRDELLAILETRESHLEHNTCPNVPKSILT
jgi:hypothetical protein